VRLTQQTLMRTSRRVRGGGRAGPIRARWCHRARAVTVLGAVVCGTVAGGATPIGSAAPLDTGAPTLTVEAGVSSFYDPGDHVVISATVEASQVFQGSLSTRSEPSGTVVSRDVDVAGGTTKTFRLIVSTARQAPEPLTVQLLDQDGSPVADRVITLKVAEEVELVGVLPAMASRAGDVPEKVNLATATGTALIDELAVDVLTLGTGALDVFDSIVATSGEINALTPDARGSLGAWLQRGGRLLLDDSSNLGWIPDEWAVGDAGYSLAGRGEIRLLDGAASAGEWASFIEPSGSLYSEMPNLFFGGGTGGSVDNIQSTLASRAGVRLPSLTPILIVLAAYLLVVSVLVFVILKLRRRLTMAWLVIPLLALTSAAIIAVAGGQWRESGRPAAATFVDGNPLGAVAQTSVLAFSRDGGSVVVNAPSGWQSDSEASQTLGRLDATPQVDTGAQSTALRIRLEAGQVSTAVLTGPTANPGIVVDAQLDQDGRNATGTVRNAGAHVLRDVAVFSTSAVDVVGDVAPGASVAFSVAVANSPIPNGAGIPNEWRSDGDESGADASIAEPAVWDQAGRSQLLRPSGLIRVAGWTDARPSDLAEEGLSTRSLVSTLAVIQAGPGSLDAALVRADNVRPTFSEFANRFGDDSTFRFLLPPTALGQLVTIEVPAGVREVEVWTGTRWQLLKVEQRRVLPPPSATATGALLVRLPFDEFGRSSGVAPTVRGRTAQDV
jgi:hypothetical protein